MPKKYLGQYYLLDTAILLRIIDAAQLTPDDLIIEIGPGPGRLTKLLSETAGKVIAIELDEELYDKLRMKFASYPNVELIHGDALGFRYSGLPEFKVVSNIPYYITTPIIFTLLEKARNLKSMTLTVQKEVGERIVAKPGGKTYGVLSLMVQYFGRPTLKFTISRKAFRPVPKVDSAVIAIESYEKPPVAVSDKELFFSIIRTAFSQRRKMVSNALRPLYRDSRQLCERAEIDPMRRPETLNMVEFARLANVLFNKRQYD
jgi:16S rRNA (adenine1518-N6/adenine1519-N6)-dimethyltransferase